MTLSPFDDLATSANYYPTPIFITSLLVLIATMHFGEPRATIDIDLVLNAAPEDAARIASAFRDERTYSALII